MGLCDGYSLEGLSRTGLGTQVVSRLKSYIWVWCKVWGLRFTFGPLDGPYLPSRLILEEKVSGPYFPR